ncbi:MULTISPECIES: hypothetical protein [Xenorhabdus]|uniref:hypothetical protein n=1 Tax=Xenorhabdus TaxID=626 RepID=UPI00064B3E88|nr:MULTISPECIES: hypothetical protein [Xenorhabdus]KLU15135.1 hypothetical protein AAY47_12580 [Xenorhabdus griffiniae]KOP34110.1 hypothetical protein AFK69_06290 [Xenorhabdus sp. GDc328]
MKRLLLSLFFASSIANAAWITNVEESIFGDNSAVLIGELKNTKSAIVFKCDSNDLSVSYVELVDDSDIKSIPATFLMRVDSNQVVEFDTTLQRRNSDAIDAKVTDREKILSLLKQLSSAKQKVLAGISVDEVDYKQSFSGNVSGSTVAVNKFAKACNLNIK